MTFRFTIHYQKAITVSRNSTIGDLKRLIKVAVNKIEEPLIHPRKLSWKYVWKNNCLQFNDMMLWDDEATIGQLGIGKDSNVYFKEHKKRKK